MENTVSKTLDNGLKVSVHPFPGLETTAVCLGVRFGSIDEEPRINGAAHFLEHMLFKGTKKRTWKEIDDQLKELGVRYNATTDHETTLYFMQSFKDYFGKTMEILSDMVNNSTIPENEFELERGPIINENMMHHDNPRYMISDYIPRVLYRKHPAKMSVGGDNEKTIRNTTRDDLARIYERYYTPKNCVLSIYGGISSKDALSLAERYFGVMDRKYRGLKRRAAVEKPVKRSITIERRGIRQARIGVGFLCKEYSERDIDEFIALNLAERYIGDKLFEEIREKKGLSYDPMASYNSYSTFGFIAGVAGIEPKNYSTALKIMIGEFEKLQNGEVDKKEFERTKKSLSVETRIVREDTLSMVVAMADYELMYGGNKLLDKLPKLYSDADINDFMKYLDKYIDIDKCGTVFLKPR